ncbi:P-loop containing nucleoside triphosphate hydrolase protein [Dacryopinax primogenitus]|uniref:p-loop containing nucleoside triphosphate hydrolase protein n=1 Tax=Dacryopinax primogenitus (strain DJM 731) TaxID=1858805 RepID=M5FP80_DACPD|nr:P-loop containing nucleoside triphosphate hydrolase protein [Dacryopinax primogenitus]EJT96873.1 P-loop containing nucleoside triphosphate hydrolase protein [Dacryopinax primogenitus]
MSIPFTIGKLIDFFSNPANSTFLGLSFTSASLLLFSLFAIGACANTGRVILMRTAGQRIVARIRNRAYASALRQEVDFVERQGGGTGDIVSRLNADTYIVGESVTGNLSDGLRAIVTASVGLGLMLYLSSKLTLVMLAVVPPISIGAVFYGRYLKKLSNQTQEALGDMSRVAEETLSAIRTVQAHNAYPMEELSFSRKVQAVFDLARREALASGLFFGGTGFSGNVTILTLLGYGGSLVARGEISVGELTSLLLYTAYVGGALSNLSGFFSSLMRGVGAGERVFSLIDRVPAVHPHVGEPFHPALRGVIRFEDVGFVYPARPDVPVLKGFNMELRTGESVALVGKSGSGKSSVQALLLRYYDPTSGRITFNGVDIRTYTPESWRATIGYVPQEPVLFSGTIASNIAYGDEEATREDIEAAAKQANCDFVEAFPKGFDTTVGKNSLSGGQRQRIAIARALLRKPAILCLDEATAALDAVSEYRVNDAIQRIISSKNTSSIVVAHRLSTITTAERLVVLEDGKISESGTYRELASRENSRFRALMAAQLEVATGKTLEDDDATSDSELENETLVDEEEPEEHIIDDVHGREKAAAASAQ